MALNLAPARWALINFFAPGLAYFLLGRKRVLGALLLGWAGLSIVVAVLSLATLLTHKHHLGPEAWPGILGLAVAFLAQGVLVLVFAAVDAHDLADAMAREKIEQVSAPTQAAGRLPATR